MDFNAINEYIPKSYIHCFVKEKSSEVIYTMPKVYPSTPWGFSINKDLEFDFQVEREENNKENKKFANPSKKSNNDSDFLKHDFNYRIESCKSADVNQQHVEILKLDDIFN